LVGMSFKVKIFFKGSASVKFNGEVGTVSTGTVNAVRNVYEKVQRCLCVQGGHCASTNVALEDIMGSLYGIDALLGSIV